MEHFEFSEIPEDLLRKIGKDLVSGPTEAIQVAVAILLGAASASMDPRSDYPRPSFLSDLIEPFVTATTAPIQEASAIAEQTALAVGEAMFTAASVIRALRGEITTEDLPSALALQAAAELDTVPNAAENVRKAADVAQDHFTRQAAAPEGGLIDAASIAELEAMLRLTDLDD